MATSLARQLQTIRAGSAAASTLDRKKRQRSHAVSLIYDPKVAAAQDLDSIYLVTREAFEDLVSIDPRFLVFERSLFSETSVAVDRYVQTAEQNAALDKAVASFFSLLAPRVLLKPAISALEWLVRRFKVNELNAELLILTFLPYHAHPVFSRILDILPTPLPPLFAFLTNSKTTATLPPRTLLTRAFARDAELFALMSEHIVAQVVAHREYHALLTFWSSFTISVVLSLREGRSSEETIAERVIPHVSSILPVRKAPDAQIAADMIMLVLISQCRLSDDVLDAVGQTIATSWTARTIKSGLATLTQTVQFRDISEDEFKPLDRAVFFAVSRIEKLKEMLEEISAKVKTDKFMVAYLLAILEYDPKEAAFVLEAVQDETLTLTALQRSLVIQKLLQKSMSDDSIRMLLRDTLSSENSALRRLVLATVAALDIDVNELELQLQTTLQKEPVQEDAVHADADAMKVDAVVKHTFEERLKAAGKSSHVTFLEPAATEDFAAVAEIFFQGLSEKIELLPMFIKNANIFPPETDLALSFLMRMWTGPYPALARIAALRVFHKLVENMPETVDLQASIVFLLIALSDSSDKVRSAAAAGLRLLLARYERCTKPSKVWAIESLYGTGPETDHLKWLSPKEAKSFLNDFIVPKLEEAILDRDYATAIISTAIDSAGASKSGSAKKQAVNLKAAVISFLASHVASSSFFRVKLPLLTMLVSAKHTAVHLSALLESFTSTWIVKRAMHASVLATEKLSLPVFEATLVKAVKPSDGSKSWQFLVACIRAHDAAGLAEIASQYVVKTWKAWDNDVQMTFVQTLLDLSLESSSSFAAEEFLHDLMISTSIFSVLLEESKFTAPETSGSQQLQQSSKRRRRSSTTTGKGGTAAQDMHKQLRKLTLVLDLLEHNQPENHTELLRSLFDVLGELLLVKTDSALSVQYTQQVLIDCLLPMVREMDKSRTELYNVRIDIIVSCIRSSSSPQVQNKFLLLVSALASLSPELVLHSVMPIFTFIGANTVRQDDEFSAHVIQQTVMQVIPALAKSTTGPDKAFGTVELLLSFVDAFPHIPYHRRVKLFTTLVKTLGAQESLAVLLRLLGKRHFDALAKGKTTDASGLEEFAELLLRGFTFQERIETVARFVAAVRDMAASNDTNSSLGGGMSAEKIAALKLDLIKFIQIVIRSMRRSNQIGEAFAAPAVDVRAAFAAAIETMLTIVDTSSAEQEYQDQAYDTLDSIVGLLPIQDVVTVLESLVTRMDAPETVRRSLAMMRTKIENDVRADDIIARNSVVTVLVPAIATVLSNPTAAKDNDIAKLALQAFEAACRKVGSVEPDAFAEEEMIDMIIGARGLQSDDEDTAVAGMICLSAVVTAVGARMIANLPKVMELALSVMEHGLKEHKEVVIIADFTLIEALVKRVPGFMGRYLRKILSFAFSSAALVDADDSEAEDLQEARSVLLEAVLTKLPARDVMRAVSANWQSVLAMRDVRCVKRALWTMAQSVSRAARKAVSSEAGRLVEFVLAVFDIRNAVADDMSAAELPIAEIEAEAIEIAMQIVLKLNDKVFRPLFVRISAWALESGEEAGASRRNKEVVAFKFFERLFGTLKSIVTSYYAYILEATAGLLTQFVENKSAGVDKELWRAVMGTLRAAFLNDQEEFWQAPARFDMMYKPLLAQISLGAVLGPAEEVNEDDLTKDDEVEINQVGVLAQAVVAFAVSCSSEEHYKEINRELVRYMRDTDEDEEAETDETEDAVAARKIEAVKTLRAIYERLGEEWLSMLPQLVPVVAELLEDENEDVENTVRRDLVPVIEGVLGESLDRYLK
ncbi:uncharacterized protein V1518DRAFT_406669 [Limtongia smithiae]|uniref:uncharacterized protein n=1 Tax=Limtongia smithiae TaxID=1125753 RepID=UPI0034D00731